MRELSADRRHPPSSGRSNEPNVGLRDARVGIEHSKSAERIQCQSMRDVQPDYEACQIRQANSHGAEAATNPHENGVRARTIAEGGSHFRVACNDSGVTRNLKLHQEFV
jgi:hypothetical protein